MKFLGPSPGTLFRSELSSASIPLNPSNPSNPLNPSNPSNPSTNMSAGGHRIDIDSMPPSEQREDGWEGLLRWTRRLGHSTGWDSTGWDSTDA
jgi:hypothetical protein